MLELLSPAGSMEALRAAVCNGADAVYLGADVFNARGGARNFTPEELPEAVRYCHVRGVQVHLTLNTLVTDREMQKLAGLIASAARAGVDAFIVQDLGVLALCRQIAPQIALHASTQMSIHSLEGVRQAAALGVSRVVLARELPQEDIAFICKNSPVEIEVFVHGALCMCYSGQCYMSAVIGRRSGNRGQCAQPCRMAYGYDRFDNKYPLSLKDNCLISYLRELEAMGVASIKIEGRMKRPEYVAAVTATYRHALSGAPVDRVMMQTLRAAFSRQGFTQGYYQGKTGPQMFGVRGDEREDKAFLQEMRATYENVEPQRVPVRFYALIAEEQPAMLAVQDDRGNTCRTTGMTAQRAQLRALTAEELQQRVTKTGGTPYLSQGVRCVIDPGLTLPAAEINRMRRDVLAQLTALRARTPAPELGHAQAPDIQPGMRGTPALTVSVTRVEQITRRLLQCRPAVLYVPLAEILAYPEVFQRLSKRQCVAAVLPRVVRDDETPRLLQSLTALRSLGVGRVLVGNLGQISLARSRELEIAGDFGLNLFNSRAMEVPKELGLVSATASFEMTLAQLRDLSKPLPLELIAYGRLPLMLTENCLIRGRTGACACQNGTSIRLVDRKGEEFRVIRDGDTCRSVLLNGKKLFLLDKQESLRKLGLWALRLSFTTENPAELDGVLAAWQSGRASFDPGACTRGLYQRGVE